MQDKRCTKKAAAAAVSMLAVATTCTAATASPCCASAASSSHPSITPVYTCRDNKQSSSIPSNVNKQAAELLSLRIPRGGSSTEKDAASSASSSSKAKGKETKSRKKKRGTNRNNGSTTTENNTKSDKNDNDSTSSNASSSSQQQQQHEEESSKSTLSPAAQSILAQTCHYDVLGITKSASSTEIQKAYRRRCILTHPDKTQGDRSAFDKVSEAYDVLSCENKRAIYDRFGMEGLNNDGMSGAAGSGGGFNDVFRDFFSGGMGMGFGTQFNPGGGSNSSGSRSSSTFGPRNRDLRYQLEVTLEDLYNGTTKHIAIQQPNPLRPHGFPLRKEVEVTVTKGMHSGQSVRLAGVVDSIPDAAPADVVFLIKERRHPVYTRRGSDLAMEVRITLAEAIVGFRKKIVGLDGKEIVIGNPYERINVRKDELVDAPSLPELDDDGDAEKSSNNSTKVTSSDDDTSTTNDFPVQQIVKTTTTSYHLPSKIIQTGDVHVLKGKGMPIRGGSGGHDYGDLYVQYIVELPGGSSSSLQSSQTQSQLNTNNLSPHERVELARLLSKLEGKEDPTTDVIQVWEGGESNNVNTDAANSEPVVHRLSISSASEFGRSPFGHNDHDDHLHEDDEEEEHHRGMHNFFQRAFHGGSGRSQHSSSGFSGPFGFGGASSSPGGGFRYYSSSTMGGNRAGPVYGDEDGHNDVQCQQM